MMRKNRRMLAALTAAMMTLTVLAGCSSTTASSTPAETGSAPVSGSEKASPKANPKTVLTVWHTWGAGPGTDTMQKQAKVYNATNDKNIEVKFDFVANKASGNTQTMDKLMAAIAAGSPPEIALLDNFQVATWAQQNALVQLDELMTASDTNFDGIYAWATEGSKYRDNIYSIPYNGDTRALFYNKDMFEAAGLDPEAPPSTIAQLEAAAEKLTIKEGNVFKQVGFIPWLFAGKPIYTWGWSFGGEFYDKQTNTLTIADPKNVEALQWEVDFANKYGGKSFLEFASGLGTGAQDPFATGVVAMAIRGNFDIANMAQFNPDMNYGIAPIPSKVEGENITWAGGWGMTIPRGANNQEASMDFMKFCLSEEGQKIMSEGSGSLSARQSVTEAVFGPKENYKTFMDLMPTARIRPPVPVGQLLWDNLNQALDAALVGNDTPENLLKALDVTMNEELKKLS